MYPRLDENVSKSLLHLLKAPFCVHPKTGKVCVPIPVDEWNTFDLDTVPTLDLLEKQDEDAIVHMRKAIAYFDKFVKELIADEGEFKLEETSIKKEEGKNEEMIG
jgi:DNA primase small subunit